MQVGKQLLRAVLGSDGTRFEIPLYQRTFDWEEPQFEKLWADVRELARTRKSDPQAEHFLGTLVLDSGHKIPNDFTFLVVDGQQRLTTLTVLLIAVRDIYREFRSETTDADELEDGMLVHRYKKGHPERFRLWPTQGDRQDFVSMLNGELDPSSSSNLMRAYKHFRSELLRTVAAGAEISVDDVKSAVLDGLRFVSITAEASDNVYGIFESLNNTGLKLTQGDLLRNFYFSRLGELAEDVYESFWFPMQERLSRDDLTHLFWLDLTLKDTEAKKDDTFKKQSNRVDGLDADALREDVKRFNQLSIVLEVMRQPSRETDPQVRRALQRLVDFGIESIDPLVLGLMHERHVGSISSGQTAEALAILESFLVRRLIVRAPHNALSRILMRAYGALRISEPAASLREYFSKDNKDFAADDAIRAALVSVNFYRSGTARQRKTLLSWIEEELAGNEPAGLAKATIEHVLPQNLTEMWRTALEHDLGDFTSAEAVHEAYVHTLANLTLSGYNSKMSDHPFEKKRDLLIQKSNIELNKWIAAKDAWGRQEILDRGEYLAELIARTWKSPLTTINQSSLALEETQVADALARIPKGKWVTFGTLAEFLQSTPADVKEFLGATSLPFAWRAMDPSGRHTDPISPISFAAEYTKKLVDEGVQFEASGEAMRAHLWTYSLGEDSAHAGTDEGGSALAGPVREFLDSASNRLTPAMSRSLHAALNQWSTRGGRVLIGVDPSDSESLSAVLEESDIKGDPVVEFSLTPANGLRTRRRGQLEFAIVASPTDVANILADASVLSEAG